MSDPDAGVAVIVSSFGRKYGPELDADWVLDARMIRNPFWVDRLRPFTGLDDEVREYVLQDPAAAELLRRATDLITWARAEYLERGRRRLHVAVGCTGGRHRSVVLAEAIAAAVRASDARVTVRHRDVDKPDPRCA